MEPVGQNTIHSQAEWLRYFPFKNKVDYSRLKISKIGRYSISKASQADQISMHIANHIDRLHLGHPSSMSIVDATAGIGGNTLSFMRYFHQVVAIEKDPIHFHMLKNNMAVYNFTESAALRMVNADFTHIYREFPGSVYFIDPPWNSDEEWYSRKKDLMLFLSDTPIYHVVNLLFSLSTTRLVNLKVPHNFDFNLFIKKVNNALVVNVVTIHTYFLVQVFPKIDANV